MKRLSKEDQKRLRRNRMLLLTAAGIVLVLAVVFFCRRGGDPGALQGTWVYSSNTEYDFDGKRSGVMRTGGEAYTFTYRTRGSKLMMTYEDPALESGTYEFSIDGTILTLAGQEGTAGGVYQLVLLED